MPPERSERVDSPNSHELGRLSHVMPSLHSRSHLQGIRPPSRAPIYIDLTQDDEDPGSESLNGDCLAYCHYCWPRQHLQKPINRSLALCPKCHEIWRVRFCPCTCPPPDHDAILRGSAPGLAAELDASDPALSNLAKRVLLLVAQVPLERYTTYIALADFYLDRWGRTARRHIGSALKKREWWPIIPVHRVVAKNASVGTDVEWGEHGQPVEERMALLRDEGVRFDSRGKLLGASFVEFR